MFSKAEYNATSLILWSHPGWTNKVNNGSRLHQEDSQHKRYFSDSGCMKCCNRSKRACVYYKLKFVSSQKPGDLIVNSCCGTIVAGRAYLLLPQHFNLVRCARDRHCMAESLLSFISRYVCSAATKWKLWFDWIRRGFDSGGNSGGCIGWNCRQETSRCLGCFQEACTSPNISESHSPFLVHLWERKWVVSNKCRMIPIPQ